MVEDLLLHLLSIIIKAIFAAITILTVILAVSVKKLEDTSPEELEIQKMASPQLDVIFNVSLVVVPLYALGFVWFLLDTEFFRTEIALGLLTLIQVVVFLYLAKLLNRKIIEKAS